MVLIHGLAMDLTFWDPQIPALAQHFEVIRYDTRGHGASEQADPPYSLELMADDLDHFMRSIGVRAAHLVGLSMGGMIAQTYALSHPNDILSLTLASTTSEYPPEGRQTFRERAETAHDSRNASSLGWYANPMVHRGLSPEGSSGATDGALRCTWY